MIGRQVIKSGRKWESKEELLEFMERNCPEDILKFLHVVCDEFRSSSSSSWKLSGYSRNNLSSSDVLIANPSFLSF